MKTSSFEFGTAGKIIFGPGKLEDLSSLVDGFGHHVFIVKGKKQPDPAQLFSIIDTLGIKRTTFVVASEPTLEMLIESVKTARQEKCDFVIGFGGGAVIDLGKAVAALLNNDGDILDYLEVVGKGLPFNNPSKPYIAIPTTAGTGSEVTKNSVIAVEDQKVKVSIRNDFLLPTIAIIDPELTMSIPPEITATTGMDAFTQVIEPYVTKITNPLVDIFCREGIQLAGKSLYKVFLNGSDISARTDMSYVSLLGGLSLANAKLGAVHGFAGPIGGMFHAPHGAICAALLPSVMKVNAELVSKDANNLEKTGRFLQISKWITGDDNSTIEDGVNWIQQLSMKMSIPGLAAIGISRENFPEIISKSKRSSSMKGNPVLLSEKQMIRILETSL